MTTTTSFSNKGRFAKLYQMFFRRNLGYLGLISVLTFLMHPLQYMMEVFKPIDLTGLSQEMMIARQYNPFFDYEIIGRGQNYTPISIVFFYGLMLLAPIVLALLFNQYMHNKKAVDVYHSLPIRRQTLLGANIAVGMSYLAIPAVLFSLLVMVVQIAKFGFHTTLILEQLIELGGWLVCSAVIYLIVTFACVLSGTVFNSLIYSGILLAVLPAVCGLYVMLSYLFLFGYTTNEHTLWLLTTLSPMLLMPFRTGIAPDWERFYPGADSFTQFALRTSHIAILVYLILAVLLLIACMKLYRHRPSEIAENISSKGVLPILTKQFLTFSVGILTGLLFLMMFSSKTLCLIWTIIGAIVANLITEIILNRGFKTLGKSLPVTGIMLLMPLLSIVFFINGGFGYQNYTPALEKIASIEISGQRSLYDGYSPTNIAISPYNKAISYQDVPILLEDSESIASMVQLHKSLASNLDKSAVSDTDIFSVKPQAIFSEYIEITYRMKNGRTICRAYNSFTSEQMQMLTDICSHPNVLAQNEAAFFTAPEQIDFWEFGDAYGVNRLKKQLSQEQSQQMLDAIKADLLTLAQTDGFANPQPGVYAAISFATKTPQQPIDRFSHYGHFVVTSSKQQTYQLLEQFGILEELTVDLENAYAVGIFTDSYYHFQFGYGIRSIFPSQNSADSFDGLKRRQMEYQSMLSGEHRDMPGVYIVEDPDQIKLLATQVVASYNVSEPTVYVSVYFKDAQDAPSMLMLPYSKLPKALQEKIAPMLPSELMAD